MPTALIQSPVAIIVIIICCCLFIICAHYPRVRGSDGRGPTCSGKYFSPFVTNIKETHSLERQRWMNHTRYLEGGDSARLIFVGAELKEDPRVLPGLFHFICNSKTSFKIGYRFSLWQTGVRGGGTCIQWLIDSFCRCFFGHTALLTCGRIHISNMRRTTLQRSTRSWVYQFFMDFMEFINFCGFSLSLFSMEENSFSS